MSLPIHRHSRAVLLRALLLLLACPIGLGLLASGAQALSLSLECVDTAASVTRSFDQVDAVVIGTVVDRVYGSSTAEPPQTASFAMLKLKVERSYKGTQREIWLAYENFELRARSVSGRAALAVPPTSAGTLVLHAVLRIARPASGQGARHGRTEAHTWSGLRALRTLA